jgi:hypothetical protein
MAVTPPLAIGICFVAASIASATASIDFAPQRDDDPPVRQMVDRAFAAVTASTSTASAGLATGLAPGRGDRLHAAAPAGGARSVTIEQHVDAATSALVRLPLDDAAGRGRL